jgi:hypothetical protein
MVFWAPDVFNEGQYNTAGRGSGILLFYPYPYHPFPSPQRELSAGFHVYDEIGLRVTIEFYGVLFELAQAVSN